MSKEAILAAIKKCAQKLERVPRCSELEDFCPSLNRWMIRNAFGGYTLALREAGYEDTWSRGSALPVNVLFRDWAEVVRKLKKLPTTREYSSYGRYSQRPLLGRYKSWGRVPGAMEQFIVSQDLEDEYEDVLVLIRAGTGVFPPQKSSLPRRAPLLTAGRIFGAPLMTTPLAFGPTNEQGVVFLFGMLAERLGFVVVRIQREFPDGEALLRLDEDQWQHVRIEFEYESRNFLKHMHATRDCDVIVCWKHNWPDCPLEVVELKAVAKKLVEQGEVLKPSSLLKRFESHAGGE